MKRNIAVLSAFVLLTAAACSSDNNEQPRTSDDVSITTFRVIDAGLNDDQIIEGEIEGHEIILKVPYESYDSLTVEITAPEYVDVFPGSGTYWKLTDEVCYFYAKSGLKTSEYTVRVSKDSPQVPTVMRMSPVNETGAEYKYTIDVRSRRITVTTYEDRSAVVKLDAISLQPTGTTATIDGMNAVGLSIDFDLKDTYVLVGTEGGNEVRWTIDNVRVSPTGVDLSSPQTYFNSNAGMLESMNSGNVRDAVISNGYVYYTSRVGGAFVYYNSVDNIAGGVDTPTALAYSPGFTGGTFAISAVAAHGDHIYASNMGMAEGSPFKIYHWANRSAEGELISEFTLPAGPRLGDAISVDLDDSGNGRIFAANFSNTKSFYVFPVTGFNNVGAPVLVEFTSSTNNGQYTKINPVVWEENMYMVTGAEMGIVLFRLDDNNNYVHLSEITAGTGINNRTFDAKTFSINDGNYMVFSFTNDGGTRDARLYIADLSIYLNTVAAFESLSSSGLLMQFPSGDSSVYAKKYGDSAVTPGATYGTTSIDMAGDGSFVRVFAFSCQRGYLLEQFDQN